MNKMHTVYITETKTNVKERLHKSPEFCDWKNQVKMDSTMFLKPDFAFLITKKGLLHRLYY
jgi:hypothetical protein